MGTTSLIPVERDRSVLDTTGDARNIIRNHKKKIICNASVSKEFRKSVLGSHIQPILMYVSESWTISKLVRHYL